MSFRLHNCALCGVGDLVAGQVGPVQANVWGGFAIGITMVLLGVERRSERCYTVVGGETTAE
jgi:hypothetical protein